MVSVSLRSKKKRRILGETEELGGLGITVFNVKRDKKKKKNERSLMLFFASIIGECADKEIINLLRFESTCSATSFLHLIPTARLAT